MQKFNLSNIITESWDSVEPWDYIETWDVDKTDKVYTELLNLLELKQTDVDYLSEYGYDDLFNNSEIFKSVPTKEEAVIIMKKLQDLNLDFEGVPGFYYDRYIECWRLNTKIKGIMMPVKNLDQKITGIQILTYCKSKKYIPLSSEKHYKGKRANILIHCPKEITEESKVYITDGLFYSQLVTFSELKNGTNDIYIGLENLDKLEEISKLAQFLRKKGIENINLLLSKEESEEIREIFENEDIEINE